jgi:predicted nucleic acid-binding Zn ribbon protein
MPVYVYGVILPDDSVGKTFEIEQSVKEAPLTHHPVTGQPIRRVICAPFVAGKWSESGMKSAMSDSQLESRGFTKYVKMGNGRYEKRAGQEPDLIFAE